MIARVYQRPQFTDDFGLDRHADRLGLGDSQIGNQVGMVRIGMHATIGAAAAPQGMAHQPQLVHEVADPLGVDLVRALPAQLHRGAPIAERADRGLAIMLH